MRKIISITLLILFALTVWSVLVFGKAKKEGTTQGPTQIQKTEPNIAPETFPKTVLPKTHPRRPTMDDFQKEVLDHKGLTKEQIELKATERIPVDLRQPEKEPTYCTVSNISGEAYWHPKPVEWLHCWGRIGVATFLDLETGTLSSCSYPHYPFQPVNVLFYLYSPDTCTIICESRIYSADYSGGGPYPDSLLCSSDSLNPLVFAHPGGLAVITVPLDTPACCLNEPFFGVWVFDNSNDFYDTVHCDPVYSNWLCWASDFSGRRYQSYWNPLGLDGSWYDVIEYGLTYGALALKVRGYTADQNTCPEPSDPWKWKGSFDDSTHYAPSGMPDFYQYQGEFPGGGVAYSGPAAAANAIWWFAASGEFKPVWGGWTPEFPPVLISKVATEAQTDPVTGTECDSLEKAILRTMKYYGGWWFAENTIYKPDFWNLQHLFSYYDPNYWALPYPVNSNIILLLGFWQQQPDSTWKRFGGNFVTLTGVDIFNYIFAFSDPAQGFAENGSMGLPYVGSGSYITPHQPVSPPPPPAHENAPVPDPPTMHPSGYHNDAGNVSHDPYSVAWPSASPGGTIWLPDYVIRDGSGTPKWELFQGQNFRPEHLGYYVLYNPGLPVTVEVEQAIVVWAGTKEMGEVVHSSKSEEINDNHGGIDHFGIIFPSGSKGFLIKGSLIVGQTQSNLNCDYGAYYWDRTFDPSAPPVLDTFVIAGSAGDYTIQQLTNKFAHRFIPGLNITMYAFGIWEPVGGAQDCEYVIEDVYVLENSSLSDIAGLENGMLFDYVAGGSDSCLVDFDQAHQSMWMWDNAWPEEIVGLSEVPAAVGNKLVTGWGLSNVARINDRQYLDSLKSWMENLGWGVDNPATAENKSLLMSDSAFTLPAGGVHLSKWFKWGYDTSIASGGDANWRHFLYRVLHQFGYYRGDVNQDGKEDVSDVVYKINYLFKGGPRPIVFVDQGDVNGDDKMTVSDVVYEVNYLFKGGPAPIDKNRFFTVSPFVDARYKALGIRNPGLFGEPDWKDLGK